MTTKQLTGLYAITDSQLMPDVRQLLLKVESALKGGARLVQYRDKSGDQEKREREARALCQLCHHYGRPLLINDDLELARKVNAQGIHLGQTDGDPARARQILGDRAIIGITCHDSMELAIKAEMQGADYVAFGAVFASGTKPHAQRAPLSLLKAARDRISIPIVAIGGIRVDNARQVIDHQADMVAVVHHLFGADDIEDRARAFASLFSEPTR
jgi:thiamine-phosphate pyrophosphorylase